MINLTFYHQVRADGGERTGIEVNGTTLLHFFQPETGEADPALLWYTDVRCEGESLPADPLAARDWFLRHEEFFAGQLTRIADDELGNGVDAELRPFRREVEAGPDGARVVIVVSAIRRLVAREIAKRLRAVAANWPGLIGRLAALSVV